MVSAQRELFAAEHGIAARTVYAGRGEGGDRTLVIDRRCEDIVFAELAGMHAQGHEFTAISEERGEVAFGDGASPVRIVIDPIDGSLNARRMIPAHSLSIAVAAGPTMADVEYGYVYDFGPDEEFRALRGEGALLDDEPIRAQGPGYGLEVVGLESARPEVLVPVLEGLAGSVFRVRSVGSIAISLCCVAAGRFDAMLTARTSRSVDAAAGQLIAREAGASVEFGEVPLDRAALALDARYPLSAGLEAQWMATLRRAQRMAEPPVERRDVPLADPDDDSAWAGRGTA